MGHQVIKQPDGLYALFSSNVDNFIYINMTKEEYIESRIQEFTEKLKRDTEKLFVKLDRGEKPYYQFTNSFEDCLKVIKFRHGEEELDKLKKHIKF